MFINWLKSPEVALYKLKTINLHNIIPLCYLIGNNVNPQKTQQLNNVLSFIYFPTTHFIIPLDHHHVENISTEMEEYAMEEASPSQFAWQNMHKLAIIPNKVIIKT